MPDGNLVCNRCNTRLLAESAVSVLIEVVIAGRVIERLEFYDFHPACAKLAANPVVGTASTKRATP